MNEILQKTYDVLDARGWCQGQRQDRDGKVCLEGAFLYASGGVSILGEEGEFETVQSNMRAPETQAAWLLLCETVKAETGIDAPYAWNDQPSTTVEDVKLVLKKAISAEED